MADVDKIILERAEDGEHWKVRAEGDEVEGHMLRGRGRFEAEPAGKQQAARSSTLQGRLRRRGHGGAWFQRPLVRRPAEASGAAAVAARVASEPDSVLPRLRRLRGGSYEWKDGEERRGPDGSQARTRRDRSRGRAGFPRARGDRPRGAQEGRLPRLHCGPDRGGEGARRTGGRARAEPLPCVG